MNAQVEIKTGERSVLGFLLQPVLKVKDAMREN
jgi:hypothetical protein